MHPTIQDTVFNIQYVTDSDGTPIFVQIPFPQWEIIRARLLHEEENRQESPEVIDRDGILVVKAKPLDNLMQVVQADREHRISDLLKRVME